MTVLQLKNIGRAYDEGSRRNTVLDNVTYTFTKERTVAITGISGSGKSTLMHIIAGIDTPQSGMVLFNGTDIATFTKKQHAFFLQKNIGFLFQSSYLIPELSVIENIIIKGLIAGHAYDDVALTAYDLLKMMELEQKKDMFPSLLSGGEQQRVSLARALLLNPDFILADEPTAHLDMQSKKSIISLFMHCRDQKNMGLIIATHDEMLAEAMDITLKLENGLLSERSKYTQLKNEMHVAHL